MSESPIGVHGLVFTGDFDAEGTRRTVGSARAAGFDLVEFPLMEPTTFDAGVARAALEAEGMRVTASLGLPEHADVSSDDAEVVARAYDCSTSRSTVRPRWARRTCAGSSTARCASTWRR